MAVHKSFIFSLLFCTNAFAASPYLPLKQVPEIENKIQQLLAISDNSHLLSKPYKVSDIRTLLQKIKQRQPELYQHLDSFISRYEKPSNITFARTELSHSNTDYIIPNQRGTKTDEWLKVDLGSYIKFNDNMGVSVSGFATNENVIASQSFFYIGNQYVQLDIGYREHWYSPFNDSAMLLSSNAETTPSLTLSSVQPLTNFNIRYDIFISQMSEQSGIRKGLNNPKGNEYNPGKPYLFGMHTSFAATENLSIGFSRLMQFGGATRKVTFADFFEGFFTPGSKDNITGDEQVDENYELGDQLGTLSFVYNNNIYNTPFELYSDISLEDTLGGGSRNNAYSFGLFLPFLALNHSLRLEHSNWQHGWYGNSIYLDGNRNYGNVIGHWAGDQHDYDHYLPAKSMSLNWQWQLTPTLSLDTTARYLKNKHSRYQESYQMQSRLSQQLNDSFINYWGVEFFAGEDVYNQRFAKLAVFAGF